jgi:hypothetical protein
MSPALLALINALSTGGDHSCLRRSYSVDGCEVKPYFRFARKGKVTVSAPDGDCVITFDGGRAVVEERASNLGSAVALALAQRIAGYINTL